MNQQIISAVVSEVLAKIKQENLGGSVAAPAVVSRPSKRMGVFDTAEAAAQAARKGQEQLRRKGIATRVEIVNLVKSICTEKADEWGKLEFAETKIGRLDHKIAKLLGIQNIPGIEWLNPYSLSGDNGIMMEEYAPFGVVAAITPVTHSIPTISGNIVSMVAAGNGVVFNAHPGGAACAAEAIAFFNQAIYNKTGIENLVTIIEKPTIESFNDLCKSSYVDLMCVTGGPAVVNAAMQSGKRAICAGPGNPPVVVDETADLDHAARSVILGGGFDNNLLCIGEKQVFVVDSVHTQFMEAFKRAGAHFLPRENMKKLAGEVFTYKEDGGGCSHPVLNRDYVGADATKLAHVAGTSAPAGTEVLFGDCPGDCPFVEEEQMMPVIPVVRAKNVDEAIELAYQSEHGYRHSAIMHSKNLDNLTKMGQKMDCTLFVKNGASIAGLGMGGHGYANFSVATTTGEGIVTTQTFTRKRRCVMVDSLNIIR
ncbi:aldehyde dehydrogenase [Pelagicoccus sp. SDUM812005]|uniref:aldehyde dehydrogenase n=1 Tax=Pelagicoccus sp. SDUM812005 TaxID=3041257 RepID=UPI00280D3048|nr:aldehyde dehydrogenase [Pelagicoccus sp. SDUM812005]MDQ8180023.1 aldehyde dehydrogenase [Pelagicoccus sp. SDUM812005]